MAVRALPAARRRPAARLAHRAWRLAARAAARVLRWHELARQRRALLALNEHMLEDIGISRAEAEREASRPFWRNDIAAWPAREADREKSFELRTPDACSARAEHAMQETV